MSCAEVAAVLFPDDDTVRTWFRLYMEDGIEGLRVPNLKEQILFSVTTVPDSFHKTNSINCFRGILGLKRAVGSIIGLQ